MKFELNHKDQEQLQPMKTSGPGEYKNGARGVEEVQWAAENQQGHRIG